MGCSKHASGFESPAGRDDQYSLVSVQELTKEPLIAIPHRYVRVDDPHHPKSTTTDDDHILVGMPTDIPTIDMSKLVKGDLDELEKLHLTCKDWGIFQLVNHGIDAPLLEKLKNEIENFFKLPLEVKMKYQMKPGEFEGYGTIVEKNDDDKILDWGDRFYMLTNPVHRRKPHLLPELPSSLMNTLENYIEELNKLGMRILKVLGGALNMEEKEMEELMEDGMQAMRATYYPPCPKPDLVVGLTPHSDATVITILRQLNGVNGLQIKRHGLWIPVNLLQEAFVVNVGDVLEIMSNGAYKSVEHRVMVNSSKERMSVAMFVNPKFEAEIGPVAGLTGPLNPPLFKRVVMEKYFQDFFSRRRTLDGKSFLEQMRIKNE